MSESELGSEVARLRQCIHLEYEAAQRGLYGTAQGTAQHTFISQRLENMVAHHQTLTQLIGQQEAIKILVEVLDRSR